MLDLPPAPSYRLRPATENDFELIYTAREIGLKEHVERIWGWNEREQRDRFGKTFDPANYNIVVIDGQDIGVISVRWSEEAALIADLEILPAWREHGIGTALIRGVIAEAEARGLSVRLQVLHGNRAQKLYERLGFAAQTATATHILMCYARSAEQDDDCHSSFG